MNDQDKSKQQLIDELGDLRRRVAAMADCEALRRQAEDILRKAHDELERRVAERTAALTRVSDELQAIYDSIGDGLIIADLKTLRFLRANASICSMLGYSEAELLSLSLPDLHPHETAAQLIDLLPTGQSGHLPCRTNVPTLRKDGSVFYADISGDAFVYQGRPCAMGVFRDVTERRRAEQALATQHKTLKHLLQSNDHERQLIAYEIHDGLAQQLAAAIMQFQAFEALKDAKPKQAAIAYQAGLSMLHQGHYETRRLIAGVRPPILDEEGVAAALGHLVNEHSRIEKANIEYRSKVKFDRLAPTLENAIYRITQEALNNACRHSKSDNIRISLSQREARVRIEIRDWGIGFDTTAAAANRFGLEGIRQRAKLLGGRCNIQSQPGQGTRIVVEVPLVERDEDEYPRQDSNLRPMD